MQPNKNAVIVPPPSVTVVSLRITKTKRNTKLSKGRRNYCVWNNKVDETKNTRLLILYFTNF